MILVTWAITATIAALVSTISAIYFRSEAQRPGVAPYVETLEGFKDLEMTEKRLRGEPAAR